MQRWREGFTKLMHLPGDALLDVPRLTWVGVNQLHIENHTGIIHFEPSKLTVQTPVGQLKLVGEQLELILMTRDELFVVGTIVACTYVMNESMKKG
jgi:sporulation protein YqfC